MASLQPLRLEPAPLPVARCATCPLRNASCSRGHLGLAPAGASATATASTAACGRAACSRIHEGARAAQRLPNNICLRCLNALLCGSAPSLAPTPSPAESRWRRSWQHLRHSSALSQTHHDCEATGGGRRKPFTRARAARGGARPYRTAQRAQAERKARCPSASRAARRLAAAIGLDISQPGKSLQRPASACPLHASNRPSAARCFHHLGAIAAWRAPNPCPRLARADEHAGHAAGRPGRHCSPRAPSPVVVVRVRTGFGRRWWSMNFACSHRSALLAVRSPRGQT